MIRKAVLHDGQRNRAHWTGWFEFAWAKHLLEFTKRHVKAWTSWIGRQSLPVRGLLGVACLLFVAWVVWASVRVSLGVDLVQMTREWLSWRCSKRDESCAWSMCCATAFMPCSNKATPGFRTFCVSIRTRPTGGD